MGVCLLPSCPSPLNPNPTRFTILRAEQIGDVVVVEAVYPGCVNHEGRKIMLFGPTTEAAIRARDTLDPHFTPHGGPFARFQPTEWGWTMAVAVARSMEQAGIIGA